MKKILLILAFIAFVYNPIDAQTEFSGDTLINIINRGIGTRVFKGELANSMTDKIPSAVYYVDYTEFAEYVGADSVVINIKNDSIAVSTGNKPGTRSSDSTGQVAVAVLVKPIMRYPIDLFRDNTSWVNDTISVVLSDTFNVLNTVIYNYPVTGMLLEDSLQGAGLGFSFRFPFDNAQYSITVYHNSADTSLTSPQAQSRHVVGTYLKN